MSEQVLVERDGHVATLSLNRPERLNAISGPMLEQLSERLLELDADREVRAIILTGAGKGFCAGLDLQDAASGSGIGAGGGLPPEFDIRSAPPVVLHGIDTPTLCAPNGGAAGYGMDLARFPSSAWPSRRAPWPTRWRRTRRWQRAPRSA